MALHSIELCAGVGMLGEGVSAAFEYLGFDHRTVCYVEREAPAASQLATLMEAGALHSAPVWSDLLTFRGSDWRGLVDCVIAGFPCQDLSIAGRRAGLNGKRSGLFFNVLDIADDSGAWFLVLENVAGIASATAAVVDEAEGDLEERAAARVLGELADRGWNAEWITLSASDVGASHGRARWFCFAWRSSQMGHARHDARDAQHGQQQESADGRTGESSEAGCIAEVADTGCSDAPGGEHEPGASRIEAEHCAGLAYVDDVGRVQWRTGHEQDRPGTPETCEHEAHHGLANRGCHVDDAQCLELAGERIHPRSRPDGCGAFDVGGAGSTVADPGQPRLPHTEQPGEPGEPGEPEAYGRGAVAELHRAPLFAPGPADPAWAGIIAARPDLSPATEPGVRMLVDGMAIVVDESRTHQLRQVGNGVVPLCAATALVLLIQRAGIRW